MEDDNFRARKLPCLRIPAFLHAAGFNIALIWESHVPHVDRVPKTCKIECQITDFWFYYN